MLRDAFLEWFCPRSFILGLIDRVRAIKMGVNKGIDSYYAHFSILLRRWHDNNLLDNYLVSTFIGGAWPNALRIFLREQILADLATAYTLGKIWEEAQVNADFTQFEDPDLYPVGRNCYDVIPKFDSYGRDLYAQVSNNPLSIEGPPPIPVMNPKLLAIRELPNSIVDSISKVEKKIIELAVQVTARRNKRPKPTNQRTNVWCSNCKGHGHLPTKCPTPLGTNIWNNSCTLCGGNHHVSKCWNLDKVIAQVQAQNNNQWTQKDNTNYLIMLLLKDHLINLMLNPLIIQMIDDLIGMVLIMLHRFGMDHHIILILIRMVHPKKVSM